MNGASECDRARAALLHNRGHIAAGLIMVMLLASITPVSSQSGVNLSGRIFDVTGAEIENVTVTLHSEGKVLQIKTDIRGRFEFTNLPPATYGLEASTEGFQLESIEGIQVKDKPVGPLSIKLHIINPGSDCLAQRVPSYEKRPPSGAALIGIVRTFDRSFPLLSKAKLYLSRADEDRVLDTQTSNEQGEFQFGKLEPGPYRIKASHDGYNEVPVIKFWIARESQTRLVVTMLELGRSVVCA